MASVNWALKVKITRFSRVLTFCHKQELTQWLCSGSNYTCLFGHCFLYHICHQRHASHVTKTHKLQYFNTTHTHTHTHTHTVSNSLQYECVYQVTDDYPPCSDPLNIIFRAGDKIVQIGDTSVKDKGPDDFALLLQKEACEGTAIRIVPRLSPPPTTNTNSLSLGYSSLDMSEKSVPSCRQSESAVTMKVSNLLSMKPPG